MNGRGQKAIGCGENIMFKFKFFLSKKYCITNRRRNQSFSCKLYKKISIQRLPGTVGPWITGANRSEAV
jgi:hypothetical protein